MKKIYILFLNLRNMFYLFTKDNNQLSSECVILKYKKSRIKYI
jgi:hypothetical protein